MCVDASIQSLKKNVFFLICIQNKFTADVFNFDKSGINKYFIPSMAPSSVKPRISKINKSKYGNIDVK